MYSLWCSCFINTPSRSKPNPLCLPEALEGLKYLMSFIPAGIAVGSILVVLIYPLDKSRMEDINKQLKRDKKVILI